MQDFHFEFQHIPRPSNTAADALSRASSFYVSALELGRTSELNRQLGWERLREVARQDESYQQAVEEAKKTVGRWKAGEDRLLVEEGGRVKLPADQTVWFLAILEAHEPSFCRHLGVKRTAEAVSRAWWWEGWRKDVEAIVMLCNIYQRFADTTKRQEAPMVTVAATQPWEVVTMDFMSGFVPSSPGKWKGCIVVCDRFTRMMHIKECSTHPTVEEAAKLFVQLVVRAYGVPRKVITDRGTQFDSSL